MSLLSVGRFRSFIRIYGIWYFANYVIMFKLAILYNIERHTFYGTFEGLMTIPLFLAMSDIPSSSMMMSFSMLS